MEETSKSDIGKPETGKSEIGKPETGKSEISQIMPTGKADMRQLTHDLNNYLTILIIHFEQLQGELSARPDLQKRIDLLADHLKSVVSIGLELQEPIAQPPPVVLFAPTDFLRLVRDQLTMLRLLAGEGIELSLRRPAELPAGSISVIPDYFKRALIQLVRNSVEALLEHEKHPDGQARITLWLTQQHGQLLLHIQDSGPGIAADIHDTLFDPGISTRPGRLRGHGLPAVQRLAAFWQGAISFNPPSKGAHFSLSFPFQTS